jgi:septal ring factor EnvC (AmiA/AmiB activator)
MSKIPDEVIAEWAKKKKHIRDRINRINKRLKKFEKQKRHFELRLRLVKEYEQRQVQGVSK